MALAVPRLIRLLLGLTIVVASLGSQSAVAATQTTGGPQSYETPSSVGSDGGAVFDRSHSSADSSSVGAISQPRNVTTSSPNLLASFDGLNHFAQRFGSGDGDQFSLEPPDQGLCVGNDGKGNTRVVEVVNDVMRVYDPATGNGVTAPATLNSFFGYPAAIERDPSHDSPPPTQLFGPFVTDPSCLYDKGTGRWFVDVLTLDTFPFPDSLGAQDFTGANHLDIAVSQTADPTGAWTIFHINVTDDGTASANPALDGSNTTPNHNCSTGRTRVAPVNPHACIGDYPHIGSDVNGIYLTTNEYSLFGNEFHGAQIYAISKSALVSGSLVFQQFDTSGNAKTDPGGQGDPFGFALNGFTLWPSVTPTSAGYGDGDPSNSGTEHFLSSNSAAEAHDTGNGLSTAIPSTQVLSWSLTNTSSLNTATPALTLNVSKVDVGQYLPPPLSEQKSGNQPLRDCLNSNPCAVVLERQTDPFAEKPGGIDSNDSRMQQVTWVNGSLWGALDTGLNTSNHKQAGIEWFKVSTSGGTTSSGYVGLGNDNLNYPAIGITAGGNGVMAFTVVGSNFYPSAGYALIDGNSVGDVHVAAMGQGPDDGFTGYRFFADPPSFTPRPRWGDYGAAVPWGGSVWIASEYIGQSCDFATYKATNFRCGSTRTALANWDTRISLVSAG